VFTVSVGCRGWVEEEGNVEVGMRNAEVGGAGRIERVGAVFALRRWVGAAVERYGVVRFPRGLDPPYKSGCEVDCVCRAEGVRHQFRRVSVVVV
jgi:hypothetical protein